MRIVNRNEFFKLHGEVVFSKFRPQCSEALGIKVGLMGQDFVFQDLDPCGAIDSDGDTDLFDKLIAMEENHSVSEGVDYYQYQRDGLFDQDQLFMVFDESDVRKLIDRLEEVLSSGKD